MESVDEFSSLSKPDTFLFIHIMAIESIKNGRKAKRHEEDEDFHSTPRRTAVHPATHDRVPPTMGSGGPHRQPVVGSVLTGPDAS